jgi:hypothetical protein
MTARINVSSLATTRAATQSCLQQDQSAPPPAEVADSGEGRSRRLLLLERTMYRDGLTPFTSVFTVSLRGELSDSRLRQALTQMQAKHPLLRCGVEMAADGPRFVEQRQGKPIPLRIVERSADFDWEREARREWVTPFGSTPGPLVRLVWLRGDGVHELMLVAHHCICDGPSGMTLLRDLFAVYDDPHWEAGAYDSLGAIEDLIPAELLRNRAFRLRVRRRAALLRLALLAKLRRRPSNQRRPSADEMYFHRWQFHPMETRTLSERCREESVTVLAAASVAILQAFREVCGTNALRQAYTMVNARRFLPRLHPDALFGIAPGVEIRIKDLPPPGGMSTAAFWERARAVRRDLTVRVDRLGRGFYETLAALESLHDRYPRLITDTEAAPAVRHVTFSNLGRLDLPQQYRSFRINRVYSPLVMVSPSPANTLVLSSFGGAIEFSIISDKPSLPETNAAAIEERAMAILRASAGIALQHEPGPDRQSRLEKAATR